MCLKMQVHLPELKLVISSTPYVKGSKNKSNIKQKQQRTDSLHCMLFIKEKQLECPHRLGVMLKQFIITADAQWQF